MTKRDRRTYTDKFKAQMVEVYESDKLKHEIMKEYDLTQPLRYHIMLNNKMHLIKWIIIKSSY
ncbi:hypothetical protein QBE52_18500 [Clostridiaceae bacterium 35-E11]